MGQPRGGSAVSPKITHAAALCQVALVIRLTCGETCTADAQSDNLDSTFKGPAALALKKVTFSFHSSSVALGEFAGTSKVIRREYFSIEINIKQHC